MTPLLLELLIAAKKGNWYEKTEILLYNLKNWWVQLEKSLHTIWEIIQIEKLKRENWCCSSRKIGKPFHTTWKIRKPFHTNWKIGKSFHIIWKIGILLNLKKWKLNIGELNLKNWKIISYNMKKYSTWKMGHWIIGEIPIYDLNVSKVV